MSAPKLADLIDEYNEIKGAVSYRLKDKGLFDKNVPEIIFCEKSVGNSYFSLVRNQDFEIVFTYKNGKRTHQSRLDLNTFHHVYDAALFLNWGPDYCEVCWDITPGRCENF